MTYLRDDGLPLRNRAHGEGVVRWIDADNVIYEKRWWRVVRVHEPSGRITIARFRWDDGEVTMPRSSLPASVSRLKARPKFRFDMNGIICLPEAKIPV